MRLVQLLRDVSAVRRWITGLALVSLACDQSTLAPLPDAGDSDACVPKAIPFCEAGAPGDLGCVGGGADPNVGLLPADASFPVGCTANVTSATRDTVTGYCTLAATCDCESDDAGARWVCTP